MPNAYWIFWLLNDDVVPQGSCSGVAGVVQTKPRCAHSKAKWNDKYLVFVKTLIKIMLQSAIIYLQHTLWATFSVRCGCVEGECCLCVLCVCVCIDNKTIMLLTFCLHYSPFSMPFGLRGHYTCFIGSRHVFLIERAAECCQKRAATHIYFFWRPASLLCCSFIPVCCCLPCGTQLVRNMLCALCCSCHHALLCLWAPLKLIWLAH